MSAAIEDDKHPVSVTWTPMKGGQVFVVALCRRCKIVRERFIPNRDDVKGLAHLVGSDALANAGCTHAETSLAAGSVRKLPSASDLPAPTTGQRKRPSWPDEEPPTAPR